MKYIFLILFITFLRSSCMVDKDGIKFACITNPTILSEYKEPFEKIFKGHCISYFYYVYRSINQDTFVVLYHNCSYRGNLYVPYLAVAINGTHKDSIYKNDNNTYSQKLYFYRSDENFANKWYAIINKASE